MAKVEEKDVAVMFDATSTKKSYVIYMLGISLICCGQYVLLSFQSSINVEHGLGTTALSFHYASTLLVAVSSPAYLQFFSMKSGLLISDVSAFIYCLANFYPMPFIFVPGNIIYGLGKALYWVCSGCFTVYYAKLFELSGYGKYETNLSKCSGISYAAMTIFQVLGNIFAKYIFELDSDSQESAECRNCTRLQGLNLTKDGNESTLSQIHFRVSDICGAKDCQDPYVTAHTLSQYVPPNETSIYIVVGVFSGLALIGVFLHLCFAPSKKDFASLEKAFNDRTNDKCNGGKCSSDEQSGKADETTKASEKCKTIRKEILETLLHFMLPDQLLLMWLQFFCGFNKSFQGGEVTRAFVSCVYGVSEIGICLAISNACFFLFSVISGKVASKIGRIIPLLLAFCLNTGAYIFGLLWVPTETSSLWLIYVLHVVFGACDGIWFSSTTTCVGLFFPNKTSRGYTSWISLVTLGGVIGYAWSTSVCVNVKIYVLLSTLCVGIVLHFVAEYRLKYRNDWDWIKEKI